MQRGEILVGNWTWRTAAISQKSILLEAVCHKIIIFFIKPSDSNLSGICGLVCVWVIFKAWGQILELGWFNLEDGKYRLGD